MAWEVHQIDGVGKNHKLTKAIQLMIAKMIMEGSAQGEQFTVGYTDLALWVEDKGSIIAVMIYEIRETSGYSIVNLTYVDTRYRRQGIFAAMNARFEEISKEKVSSIVRYTLINNVAMQNAFRKNNYERFNVGFEKKL